MLFALRDYILFIPKINFLVTPIIYVTGSKRPRTLRPGLAQSSSNILIWHEMRKCWLPRLAAGNGRGSEDPVVGWTIPNIPTPKFINIRVV